MSTEERIKASIRNVPDFPSKGINFKDITPVLEDPVVRNEIVDTFIARFKSLEIDAIVGIESRGFLFGTLLAQQLEVPFVLVRKAGKLPYKTIRQDYELEYGVNTVEMHTDSIKPGHRVMIHDDLLATGGTAEAAAKLVEKQGGIVAGFSFIIDLAFLNGSDRLKAFSENIITLVTY